MSGSGDTFYTAKQLNEIRSSCQKYSLDAPEEFWAKTADELRHACNGAGPERWDDIKRRALTDALQQYEPAFAIHDVEYEYHIGTQKTADKRLLRNMVRIWRKDFGTFRWFKIKAWIERFKVIPFVYAAVALTGGQAWEEATND